MCQECMPQDLRCPRCGREITTAEWASYRKCENCWAGNRYLPKRDGRVLITGARDHSNNKRDRE